MATSVLNPPSLLLLSAPPSPSFFLPSFLLSLTDFDHFALPTTMKLIKSINPKNLFRSKKPTDRHQISKSAPASFNTVFSASSSSSDASDALYSAHKARHRSDSSVPAAEACFDLVEAFKLIDRDGDGKISKRDLQTVLSRIGASDGDMDAMLAEIDRDGDGSISLEECAAIGSAFGPALGPDELKETFDVFDADRDGKITAEELLRVFNSIGDDRCTLDECRRMIDSVDVSGNGFVCLAEFTRMMVQQQ